MAKFKPIIFPETDQIRMRKTISYDDGREVQISFSIGGEDYFVRKIPDGFSIIRDDHEILSFLHEEKEDFKSWVNRYHVVDYKELSDFADDLFEQFLIGY